MRRGLIVAIALLAAGCGGAPGADSPELAVKRFLDTWEDWGQDFDSGDRREFYARNCRLVDPAIRRGALFDEEEGYSDGNCGAGVVVAVAYTGDSGEMEDPSRISGDVVSARTEGDRAVVTVRMRYAARPGPYPPPPASATVKVLAVRRDGAWWVATPLAFNPLKARDGGMSEAELERDHRESLARAEERD